MANSWCSDDAIVRWLGGDPRTLQRQFQQATGLGPVDWLIRERIALVKELLEAPEVPLAQVAERSGFGSMESLRRHFRRVAGTTPGAYRKRFGLDAQHR